MVNGTDFTACRKIHPKLTKFANESAESLIRLGSKAVVLFCGVILLFNAIVNKLILNKTAVILKALTSVQ